MGNKVDKTAIAIGWWVVGVFTAFFVLFGWAIVQLIQWVTSK